MFLYMHPAPRLAYPSCLGNPQVDPQCIKKKGAKRRTAHSTRSPPKKKGTTLLLPHERLDCFTFITFHHVPPFDRLQFSFEEPFIA